jgi:lysophospholipase L1-like esterase
MKGILAFGDSITFGRGVVPSTGWANKLKKYFESKEFYNGFYNLGIPGDSSNELLQRIETELKARVNYYRKDNTFIVLIAIGINDSRGLGNPNKLQTSPKQYENNMKKIIKIAKKHTKNVILIGLSPVDESLMPFEDTYFSNQTIQKFNHILQEVSKKNNLLYCDMYNKLIKQKNYPKLLVDGVHPTDKGYKLMYEIIKGFLIKKKLIK